MNSFHLCTDLAQKVTSFRKTLIKPGHYKNQQDGKSLSVSASKLQEWIKNFNKMKENGVKVPVFKEHVHDNDTDSDLFLGYISDLFVNSEGWLTATHDFIGDEQADLAERIGQVSIGVHDDYKDGEDRAYGSVIQHVACCPQVVVPGQTGFKERFAAGKSSIPNHTYVFSTSLKQKGRKNMLNEREVSRISDWTSREDVTKENAWDVLEEHLMERNDSYKSKFEASQKRLTSLEQSTTILLDEGMIEQVAGIVNMKIDMAVQSGRIPDAQADLWKDQLCGNKGNRNQHTLGTKRDSKQPIALDIMDLIMELSPRVDFGLKSGPQSKTHVVDDGGRSGGFSKEAKDLHKAMGYVAPSEDK